jgi:arsenate reductase
MTTIYHNPRCSKSRQTLALLEEQGIDFKVVEYLNNTLDSNEIKSVLKKLDKNALDIMRKNEKILKELDIDIKSLSEAKLIDLMAEHPILIERPIVVTDESARIGRPPESVLELFTD